MSESRASVQDLPLVRSIFGQLASNLGLIVDRDIQVEGIVAERASERARGMGNIHISFRMGIQSEDFVRHGCVLVPLPDAVTLVGCLTMLPADMVDESRERNELDQDAKEAMMELGNLMRGAIAEALREFEFMGTSVQFEGCQGVRADVRPALAEPLDTELLIGRARATLDGYPEFECLVLLPPFWES